MLGMKRRDFITLPRGTRDLPGVAGSADDRALGCARSGGCQRHRSGSAARVRRCPSDAHQPHQYLRQPATPIARSTDSATQTRLHRQDERQRRACVGGVMNDNRPARQMRLLRDFPQHPLQILKSARLGRELIKPRLFGNRWLPQKRRLRGWAPKAQAIFCRRRHQPRRPPQAAIRPGRPAPTMGPGTS
jgi:hypothetical protein